MLLTILSRCCSAGTRTGYRVFVLVVYFCCKVRSMGYDPFEYTKYTWEFSLHILKAISYGPFNLLCTFRELSTPVFIIPIWHLKERLSSSSFVTQLQNAAGSNGFQTSVVILVKGGPRFTRTPVNAGCPHENAWIRTLSGFQFKPLAV